ncbi:MAG TPA: efflux RND transporter permease subunit [Kofleriaceae bacterium]|jgi:multidrug efflux pump
MLANFFAHRPVFAWVISIAIMLAGIASIRALPIAQYPDVAPPSVEISANYTGASAETVENSVTQVLEQQLTGIDGLLYFSSSSSSSGQASINVTFRQGTNPDTAQVQVQNKVQQAVPRLPPSVQQQGIVVSKSQTNFLTVVAVYDATDRVNEHDIADYLSSTLQDPIARVNGVGAIQVFGSGYAMRVWLDPAKLQSFQLMPSDVEAAIAAQNVQVSAGKIGGMPSPPGQQLNATVTAQSKLHTADEFKAIIVKHDAAGRKVLLSEVADVELGSESYDVSTRLNGHPASGLAIMLAPNANALEVADNVKATVARLQSTMPAGWAVAYPFDSTTFIRISIEEVVKTLIEAIFLVIVVMFVFLQSWRATLIPVIAVPVVILGTFSVLKVLGYSINTLTMFALVLSIGLLVDDAIVVVENVERLMRDEQLSPLDATVKSMKEITGALIGVATVLAAVFLPMAFFTGATGIIYRQFSVTIVASMLLSVFVALTITPALTATMLKAHHGPRRGAFGLFNRGFDSLTHGYQGVVGRMLRWAFSWLLPYGAIVAAMYALVIRLPQGFLPDEDQGIGMVIWTLPSGASMARTEAVGEKVQNHFLNVEKKAVKSIFTIAGFSFIGVGQNAGMAFIEFKDWDERPGKDNTTQKVTQRATGMLWGVREAQIFALTPPAIQGLGQTGGFDFQLQAAPGTDRAGLAQARDQLLAMAAQNKLLAGVRRGDLAETPQLKLDIDQEQAAALSLQSSDISYTLAAAWGGIYVNDFIDRGRVKRVFMQGKADSRSRPEDLSQWYVRGATGQMTPFNTFTKSRWTYGSEALARYNGLAAASIQGAAAPGVSSGTAMDALARLSSTLKGTTYAWSGLSYEEQLASGQTLTLYAIAILLIFLALAALYESWSVPFSVLLVIPLGIVGAVLAAKLRGLENDVYFRVALVTTIGLSSKNAILIIEFAEEAYIKGATALEAALTGARLRLRPIVMTSLAFIAGVAPLALSKGAGANSRVSIGTGIIGGTLTGTILAVFFVPVFFVVVRRVVRGKRTMPT